MRAIDADVLKIELSDAVTKKFGRWDKTLTVAEMETFTRDIIDSVPTITIKEYKEEMPDYIKRATVDALRSREKWDHDYDDSSLTCSGCGCRLWANDIIDGDAHFCPNCGAKMRGKEE